MEAGPLSGLTIGITAERRASEQAELFRRRGASVLHGPALRVAAIGADEVLEKATLDVVRNPPDYLLASTGFGMRTWFEAAEGWGVRDDLLAALARARVLNRGAKAASANTAAGLGESWRAPNERFEEVVDRLLTDDVDGARVVVQLHGTALPGVTRRIMAAGAAVVEIDAYRASLPDDPRPALSVAEAASAGTVAAVTFTTAPAVHNLFTVAERAGLRDALRAAFNGPVVAACVGPVCADGARDEGVVDPLVPARARLVPLVHALTERLERERGAVGDKRRS